MSMDSYDNLINTSREKHFMQDMASAKPKNNVINDSAIVS